MNIEIGGRSYPCTRFVVRAEPTDWIAEIEITGAVEPGPCTIGGWAGTVRSVGRNGASSRLDVRAGDDALDTATTARHWAATLPAASVASTLAADAGTRADAEGQVATWRSFGGSLRAEVSRLARWLAGGLWWVREDGAIIIGARDAAALPAPGRVVETHAASRVFSWDGAALTPLAGRTVEGAAAGLVVYSWTGQGTPRIEVFAPRPTTRERGTVEGGTVEAESGDRATVRLDSGTVLGDVPLWFAAGVRAVVPAGTRVLVVDVGGDPRAPVAFATPFDAVPASELGPALRGGDLVSITFTSTPTMGVPAIGVVTLAPAITTYGPPGVGRSRVDL